MADHSLFRKKSLDKLSSPEELDRLIVVSRSGLWLSLLAAIMLIVTGILWGWFGRVDDQIVAEGIVSNNVDKDDHERILLVYGSPFKGQRVQAGMEVRFFPSFVPSEVYGFVSGKVKEVKPWPLSRRELSKQVHSQELADLFIRMAGGPPIFISVQLDQDLKTHSGLKWSSGSGPSLDIPPGSLGRVEMTINRQRPLSLVVPWIKEL